MQMQMQMQKKGTRNEGKVKGNKKQNRKRT